MNNFYVYAWYYKNNGHIFYIGKGSNEHYKEKTRSRNEYFKNIVNKYPQEIDVKFLYKNLSENDAWALEKESISYYRQLDQCEANIHDGGAGGNTHNYKQVGEKVHQYRATHSLTEARRNVVEKMHEAVRGVPKTEEWKQKCRGWLNTYQYKVYYQQKLIYWCHSRKHFYNFMKKYFSIGRGVAARLAEEADYLPTFKKYQWIIEKHLQVRVASIKSVSTTGIEQDQVEWIFPPLEAKGVQCLDEEIVSLRRNTTE